MVGWSGRRLAMTVLLFIAPTLIGIAVFSLYPLLLNVFVSFTDRGKFHPNPDCTSVVWKAMDPACWLGKPPTGLATPYNFQDPATKNYTDLLGGFFSKDALIPLHPDRAPPSYHCLAREPPL